MLKAPDRAEARALAVAADVSLVTLLQAPARGRFVAFVARLSRTPKVLAEQLTRTKNFFVLSCPVHVCIVCMLVCADNCFCLTDVPISAVQSPSEEPGKAGLRGRAISNIMYPSSFFGREMLQ